MSGRRLAVLTMFVAAQITQFGRPSDGQANGRTRRQIGGYRTAGGRCIVTEG
jgi:hypothetical protein